MYDLNTSHPSIHYSTHHVMSGFRADEAHHRLVNHTLGSMKPDETNPFKPGE